MELSYTFFYIESNIVCLFIFGLLLVRSIRGVDRQEKQRIFDGILISHILYFISDILWVLVLDGTIPSTVYSVSLINMSNAVLLSLLSFFWFVYIELSQGEEYIKIVSKRFIAFVPAVLILTVMAFLFLLANSLMLDEELSPTGIYYVLFIAMPVVYIFAAGGRSVYRAFKKENLANRATYLACAAYPCAVAVFGVLQTQWLKAPLFCFGCTITMIYVYIVSLDNQVSIDPLSRLNNRAQLNRYVTSESMRIGEEKQNYFVLMIDLNKFKSINDKYGHIEGDNAIIRTADALRKSCSRSPLRPFIARYGGDEFIVIAKTDNEGEVLVLCNQIRAKLKELNENAGVEYELTASIGYSKFDGDPGKFQQAVSQADKALYEEKEKLKAR